MSLNGVLSFEKHFDVPPPFGVLAFLDAVL